MEPDRATNDFLYSEAIFSARFPELAAKVQLRPIDERNFFLLCIYILQPARDHIGQPIKITSGKCNYDLNKAIGRNHFATDHAWLLDIHKCAVDIQVLTEDGAKVDYAKTLECFLWMVETLKEVVGQLIYYPQTNHIHASLASPSHFREVLVKIDGEYVNYDPSIDLIG